MNQGKLEVVKQEMARVNTDILEISKLKWMKMSEFNSDDHYIYYCGQEYLRRNRVALRVNKRVQNAVLGCNLKNDRMISFHSLHGVHKARILKWFAIPFSWTTFCQNSTVIRLSWVAPHGMA